MPTSRTGFWIATIGVVSAGVLFVLLRWTGGGASDPALSPSPPPRPETGKTAPSPLPDGVPNDEGVAAGKAPAAPSLERKAPGLEPGPSPLPPPTGPAPPVRERIDSERKALLARQRPNGSWDGVMLDGVLVAEPGTTALCLLAFLGAGKVPGEDEEGQALRRAVEYLQSVQTASGMIGGSFHDHNLAMLALAELRGLTGDSSLLGPLKKALEFTVKSRREGTWCSVYGGKPHTIYETAWGALALKSAKISGCAVDPGEFEGVRTWLSGLDIPDPDSRAASAAARILCGGLDDGIRRDVGDFVEKAASDEKFKPGFHFLYFGSLAAFQAGGETWARWSGFSGKALDEFVEARSKEDTKNLGDPLRLLALEIRERYERRGGK